MALLFFVGRSRMYRLSLPGRSQPAPKPPTGPLVLAALLILTATVYGYWKRSASHVPETSPAPAAVMPVVTPAPVPDSSIEDLQVHLRHVEESIIRIEQNTKRIEQRINQVSPALEQNYLQLQRQRLDLAGQLSQSVLRDAAEALEELQLTQQNLKDRRQ